VESPAGDYYGVNEGIVIIDGPYKIMNVVVKKTGGSLRGGSGGSSNGGDSDEDDLESGEEDILGEYLEIAGDVAGENNTELDENFGEESSDEENEKGGRGYWIIGVICLLVLVFYILRDKFKYL